MNNISDAMIARVVERFRALGDHTRIRIIMALLELKEANVGALAQRLEVSQATMSKHLERLRIVGLVQCRREGNQAFFRVRDPALADLCTLVCGSITRLMAEEHAAWIQPNQESPNQSGALK